ncbi:hypothetical protein EWM64_g5368, partial [Hericium alpestre]
MASSVFYKFRSQRDESRVTFDGTGISVFDLKKEVILANNLGKANDFDLAILDKSSGEEFKDDSHIIPRSSSVIVKRVPAARPGKGKAAMYIGGGSGGAPTTDASGKSGAPGGSSTSWHRGGMSRRFDGGSEPAQAPSKPLVTPLKPAIAKDDEAAAMAAMFQAQSANWEETQEKMSHTKIASLDKLLVDKPTRAKVMDYIEKEMEASRKEEESAINGGTPVQSTNHTPQPEDQQQQQQLSEFFPEQGHQIPDDIAMSQMIADSIPQLQASVQQLVTMLQNPNLPRAVRHQTEAQHHQLQMQLA